MKKEKVLIEIRDVFILIVLGYAITWFGLGCPNCQEDTRQFLIVASFTSTLWILLWKGNEYLGDWISTKISWLEYPLRRFIIGTISTIVYTFLVMYILTALFERSFVFELPDGVIISVIVTIGISLFMHGRSFFLNWRKAAIEAEQFQRESIEARYESLKNQVNPHFLFNSLNALANLVYEDENKAVVFIDELSDVYRYVIETQEKETVPLQHEVRFLESYLYLQQIRFGDKLHVKFAIDGIDAKVAPLALQMLIENAIKHNIISEDDPLTIHVRIEENFIVVENNMQKKSSVGEDSAGVGLDNIRKRYERLSESVVLVEAGKDVFRVKLPLLN
jgi:sensor histidine kinase YesM